MLLIRVITSIYFHVDIRIFSTWYILRCTFFFSAPLALLDAESCACVLFPVQVSIEKLTMAATEIARQAVSRLLGRLIGRANPEQCTRLCVDVYNSYNINSLNDIFLSSQNLLSGIQSMNVQYYTCQKLTLKNDSNHLVLEN